MMAQDQREAKVFRVASMILHPHFPMAAKRLQSASERYFERHPGECVHASGGVRKGWIIGFPRLRAGAGAGARIL